MYDGVFPDADVFGKVMVLSGPPTWRMKKFTAAEFQDIIGDIEAHARYVPIVFLSSSVFFDSFY